MVKIVVILNKVYLNFDVGTKKKKKTEMTKTKIQKFYPKFYYLVLRRILGNSDEILNKL